MTIEKILEIKDKYPRTTEQIIKLLKGTKITLIKGLGTKNDPHLIASKYQLDEFENPTIYRATTIQETFSKIKQIAVAVNKKLKTTPDKYTIFAIVRVTIEVYAQNENQAREKGEKVLEGILLDSEYPNDEFYYESHEIEEVAD